MKAWHNLILCFAVFGLFWMGFDKYLTKSISEGYNFAINDDYGIVTKDKGIILQQTSIDKGDIELFGTSELASYVKQNPRSFFPIKQMPHMTNIIGRAGVLSLEHSLNVSALDFSKNQKVVYLVSFSWFTLHSVDSPTFYANFSKYKFYQYMADPTVPDDEKIYMASKVGLLIQDYKNTDDLDAWCYARLCGAFPSQFKTIQTVSRPYLMLENAILELRDKAQSFVYLKQQKPFEQKELKDINWENENVIAEQQGKNTIHDPRFYFDDGYKNYMSDKIDAQQNSQIRNPNLIYSKEYEYFLFFLRTCKRKNIKPLIVIQSVNGRYYDYLGVTKAERDGVYQRLSTMANDYGFTALNMSDLEYTPYAFYDAWHLGWKGWIYVDQKITEYFNSNS